ncbi:uveal autoantigen with coiled-coil domains and ankyrin repeats [Eublepharis macularius]|uniref:Uveal autoantigen with coiled-coil domains and ankyrin repeats n=1 Tax=Eublepharis macularius TaxID=481883 RepID=A0AA97KHB6_EUBMA|nr:uveal autoantigen with coiled-coil domains and ankyrin repeats [Eublepharis macularius]
MKSLKSRLRRPEAALGGGGSVGSGLGGLTADWNKYDDRLMKAAERGDVEKIASVLSKKGVNPTKLDVEGRSAFHVVASKGNLECLNTILVHGVDIVATDAAGRNALHLAAKYGHALCLQKLLQYNCPTENVDLQGRTALHDAAMSDCPSSIQLLCDHGASVNAKDGDGRTPLVLATQMCRPIICQLLLDRGGDVNARDKQNRTALMLGCEYGCKDAVEVLLRNGADITLVDALGHDCSYYARIGDSVDILQLIKVVFEESSKMSYEVMKKGQPVLKVTNMLPKWSLPSAPEEAGFKPYQREHRNVQELERENEDLKGRLREIQQEHRILLERINGLQLQLNEEQMVADDLESEKDELGRLLTAKEKQQEESLRALEALKSKLRFYESDHAVPGSVLGNRKEEVLLKQGSGYSVEQQHGSAASVSTNLQSRSMVRPLELSSPSHSSSSEVEPLKRELSNLRSHYEAAKGETSRLQLELAHKTAECRALASECERTKQESDRQIKQLEDALKDVQKRMFDSEGKVKQMQTHFLALKDHLTSEAAAGSSRMAEELKAQLKDMKAKYEGASAEVGKLRNQLKQNELLVEEFRRDEGRLVEENKRLQKELGMSRVELERKEKRLLEAEGQLKESAAKFQKIKSSLSSEIDERAWKLAEMEGEREKLREETGMLRAELERQKAQLAQSVKPEEHKHLRSRYEQRTQELERAHSDLMLQSQALQKELERKNAETGLLKEQIDTLHSEMKSQYVPLKAAEELKKANNRALGELKGKLVEATEKCHGYQAEVEKLLAEKVCLKENLNQLQAAYIPPEKHEEQMETLKSTIADLKKQLAELGQKWEEERAKARQLTAENASLQKKMKEQYVPVSTHEESKLALNGMLEKTGQELLDLKEKMEGIKQEFVKGNEENGVLKRKLRVLQNQIQEEYVSKRDHDDRVYALKRNAQELQEGNSEILGKYQAKQEEVSQLHAEIEAQKKELDMIQECIKSKYAPLASLEDKERTFEATIQELQSQLLEQGKQCREQEEEAKKCHGENEKLRAGILSIQNDLQRNYILAEKAHEMERAFTSKMDDLNKELQELQQKFAEIQCEKERLQEESARQRLEALEVQSRLQGQYVPVEEVEALKQILGGTIEELKGELGSKTASWQQELQKTQELQQELACLSAASVPLAEHTRIKEAGEREAAVAKAALREKEEESQRRREEVSKLQAEVLSTKEALKALKSRELVALSEHEAAKSNLEAQVSSMAEELAGLNVKFEAMQEEALRSKTEDLPTREEKEELQTRSFSIEQEIKDQKERCDKSLTTITELQRRIQESAKQVEAKDNKITELLSDVERLKQALNGLSQLTYSSPIPTKRQNQQAEVLQSQVKSLQQQLADAERQHQEVISIYRTHLLSAVQGHMDEDVQAALLQIIRMRQGLVC